MHIMNSTREITDVPPKPGTPSYPPAPLTDKPDANSWRGAPRDYEVTREAMNNDVSRIPNRR